jgi:2-haloacid dehalogenase
VSHHAGLPQVVLFDAYGTLFDVHSVTRALESRFPGKGAALSQSWRTKQLEYTWQRTLMARHADFEVVTAEAFRYATALHHCECSQELLAGFMRAYDTLGLFAEVRGTLDALKARGARLGILSNGSPAMLQRVIAHNGLVTHFASVLSIKAVGCYKPAPAVYQLALDAFGVAREEIGFVSANGWDASGAKAFGFKVCWVNRNDLPAETSGFSPDWTLADLSGLLGL